MPVTEMPEKRFAKSADTLCGDIAFRHYRHSGGNFAACYKLTKNQFLYLEDDAADIVNRRIAGEPVESILHHYTGIHGEACKKDLISFIEEWDAMLFMGNKEPADLSRTAFKQSGVSKNEKIEREFFGRCNDNILLSSLTCELTYACQQRCVHCYNPHHEVESLSTESWCGIIEQAADLGVIRLCLTGGESTQHPGFWTILEKARSRLMAVTVQSNGQYFDSQEKMSRLAALYPRSYEVSLYAATPELHDGITGVKGSWEKTTRSLGYAKKCNIPIAIKCPAMRNTLHEIERVAEIAKELDAGMQIDLCITSKNNSGTEPLALRVTDENALIRLLRNKSLPFYSNQEQMSSLPAMRRDPEGALCGAGGNSLSISPEGDVYPCVSLMLNIGNAKHEKLENIWNGNPIKEFRKLRFKDNQKCSECEDNTWCSICPGVSLLENSDMLRENEYDCFLAAARKKAALVS